MGFMVQAAGLRHRPQIRSPALLQAEKKRLERAAKSMQERTIDAQRVSATVPRWGPGGAGRGAQPSMAL